MKRFTHLSDTDYKVITGRNDNKESDTGVLTKDGKLLKYSVKWRQSFSCYRGGKPRYKKEKNPLKLHKSRNAPGSRLMECKATINTRLMKLQCGNELLEVTVPMLSAHTNHSPSSLADLHSRKPLPEIQGKVESLISHSHLSQVSLMLALKDWINHKLIPQHLREGIIESRPSEYDRRYYPTVEDVKNMSRKVINKIRNNMFDQDALESFLRREREQDNGFSFFLRKYVVADEHNQSSSLNGENQG